MGARLDTGAAQKSKLKTLTSLRGLSWRKETRTLILERPNCTSEPSVLTMTSRDAFLMFQSLHMKRLLKKLRSKAKLRFWELVVGKHIKTRRYRNIWAGLVEITKLSLDLD